MIRFAFKWLLSVLALCGLFYWLAVVLPSSGRTLDPVVVPRLNDLLEAFEKRLNLRDSAAPTPAVQGRRAADPPTESVESFGAVGDAKASKPSELLTEGRGSAESLGSTLTRLTREDRTELSVVLEKARANRRLLQQPR